MSKITWVSMSKTSFPIVGSLSKQEMILLGTSCAVSLIISYPSASLYMKMIWTIQKILKKLKKVMMKITSLLYFWLEIKTSWEQIKLNVLCFLHFSKRTSTFFRFSLRATTFVPHFFYMFLNVFPVFPKNYSMCSSTSKNFPQRLGFSSTSKIDVPKNSCVPQRLRRWGCSSTSGDQLKGSKDIAVFLNPDGLTPGSPNFLIYRKDLFKTL